VRVANAGQESDGAAVSIGGSIHDPNDPVGRLLFNMLAMVAEFESDLIRARTREGMQIAKAKGRLRGRKPKLSPAQEKLLVDTYRRGQHTTAEIAALFNVARSTVYRTIQRTPVEPEPPETRRIRRFPAPGQETGTKRKGTTKPGIG
jgi:DNA invertase Pin-like site-specific DNA recombinase